MNVNARLGKLDAGGTASRRLRQRRLGLRRTGVAAVPGVMLGVGVLVLVLPSAGAGGVVPGASWATRASGAAEADQRAVVADATRPTIDLARFLDTWCLGCHAGPDPEAAFDLESLVRGQTDERGPDEAGSPFGGLAAIERARILRHVRRRLADGSMPPSRRRPSDAAYRDAIAATDALLRDLPVTGELTAADAQAAGVRNAPIRRLTRTEYATMVRDVLGVDFDPAALPMEEIGHGFDTNAGTLSLSPLRFEQFMDAAERIAAAAVVHVRGARTRIRRDASALEIVGPPGGGRVAADAVYLYSAREVRGRFDIAVPGLYRLTAAVAGDQAGPELVRMQLRRGDGEVLVEQEVPGQMEPMRIETTLDLSDGPFVAGAAFVNDYYRADDPDPEQRDRNAVVAWLELDGPLAPPEPTPLQRDLAARFGDRPAAQAWRDAVVHLAARAWRSPVTREDAAALLAAVDAAARAEEDAWASRPERGMAGGGAVRGEHAGDAGSIDPRRLRIAITAILAHPRFLHRVEGSGDGATEPRPLAGHELAARLALLVWSSGPDERLAADAAADRLATAAGRGAAVDRMLSDPRSLALAEHFAAQWLRIRALAIRRPDETRFPGVDAALRESMRMETVLFVDAVIREDRPISHLLRARETFVDGPLAEHYGIPGVRGPHMRRVALDGLHEWVAGTAAGGALGGAGAANGTADGDGLGILRHASILLTTSNPTRTSPVMRGKWVLEALLDDPPPPAPAFVPALDRGGEPSEHESLRELLERHRADPNCAACHRRMDPLGFALEPFDAVGRPRRQVEGRAVDAAAELPDGTRFDGPAGLRDLLLGPRRADFVRSLLRHLAIYALGRGLDPADDIWIEPALVKLGADPTMRELLLAVVESPPFRFRFPAPTPRDLP